MAPTRVSQSAGDVLHSAVRLFSRVFSDDFCRVSPLVVHIGLGLRATV